MDRILEKTLLFDFYGELLTERQREVYESVVMNDMSLSEAAEEYDITRQGIHDMIRRCDAALSEYEERLHLVEQFERIRAEMLRMKQILEKSGSIEEDREELRELADRILNQL